MTYPMGTAKDWLTSVSVELESRLRSAHRAEDWDEFLQLADASSEVSRMKLECRYWDPSEWPGHEPTVWINFLT